MPRKGKANTRAKKNTPRRTKSSKSQKKASHAKKSNENKRRGQAFSKEILALLNQLTSVLREVDTLQGNPLYETAIKLDEISERIILLQSGSAADTHTNTNLFRRQIWGFEDTQSTDAQILLNRLTLWIKREQSDSFIDDKFEFASDLAEGRGVIACRDLKQGEHTMSIDRKLMMTHGFAMNESDDKIRRFLRCDPLCQQVASLSLVLFVWYERMKERKSFWKPYLDALPLYFGLPHESSIRDLIPFLSGRASLILDKIIRLKISHLRHYTYARQMLSRAGIQPGLRLVDYLWAAGVIMTRQNRIPSARNAEVSEIALIPGWDMCNYRNGRITTYFNTKQNKNEMFAMRDTRKGEQIYIYYGSQRNELLYLNSGFVFGDNPNDELEIDLRLMDQAKDPLFKIKAVQIGNAQLTNPLKCSLPILFHKKHKGNAVELVDTKVEDKEEDIEDITNNKTFAEDDISTEWILSVFETLGVSIAPPCIRFARIAQMNREEVMQFMHKVYEKANANVSTVVHLENEVSKNEEPKEVVSMENEVKAWNMIVDAAKMMDRLFTDKLRICAQVHLQKETEIDSEQVLKELRAISKHHVALTFELLHIERNHYANVIQAITSGIQIIEQRLKKVCN